MKPGATIQYGFKRISLANLLVPDSNSSHPSRLRDEKWVKACLKPQLEPCVPEEIAFLFEVARGSMVYGMYFRPLASLASEQCYRVLEAGARHRCKQLRLLAKKKGKEKAIPDPPFAHLVAALKQGGRLPEGDTEAWETMPFLRNRYSHPQSQTIQSADSPPGTAAFTAELLNRLFKWQPITSPRSPATHSARRKI